MGFFKLLFGSNSNSDKKVYTITLECPKSYGGHRYKTIKVELLPQDAAPLMEAENRESAGRALAAVYWPGAPDVKISAISG